MAIYYISDTYFVERINPKANEEKQNIRLVDLFNWGIGDYFIVSDNLDELFICDLNGDNFRIVEDFENQRILVAENNIFIYQKSNKQELVIYDVDENLKHIIKIQDEYANCVVLDELIFVTFGYDNEGKYIVSGGGFYTYTGDLIYDLNE